MQSASFSTKIRFSQVNNIFYLNDYNPSQTIWHKEKKYSKIGQDFKNVISSFAYFLTAIVNV